MKTLSYISFALLAFAVIAGCEKNELDDHCPDSNSEAHYDPQDMRVNDDSDDEEQSSSQNTKDLNAGNTIIITNSSTSVDDGSGNNDSDDDSQDDLINDDSDNEDEGARPRSPIGNPSDNSGQR